ncbi:MAG: FAD-dependent thymidylate synthase [Candidatus Eremiobacteraeota bacterium]|nr:FAD-dependent thymidylate synthase [Candidatus Eremiobacteraeota bacterium]
MGFSCRTLLDSISPAGVRLTTMEVTFPRFVLAEFNTHRAFSRNSASSRAIPTAKLIERVRTEPAMPVEWGRNKKGMSSEELLDDTAREEAVATWLTARDEAVTHALKLGELNVHKQTANRVLEPFLWHTVIVTATEWKNFFMLRSSASAQPEIRVASDLMRDAYYAGIPTTVLMGQWHLPLVQDDERRLPLEDQKKISVARCARVSYLTHDGTRNVRADMDLFERLKEDRHVSPFEHVATPSGDEAFYANFRGWIQMRREIESP